MMIEMFCFLSGFWCPLATANYTDYPCPMGYYCPAGTLYWNEFPCPTGYFNNATERTDLSQCTSCPGMTGDVTEVPGIVSSVWSSYFCRNER